MSPTADGQPDIVFLYATFWRMVSLAVHRYGSAPTGQLLVVLTMVILDRYGYQPTVTELADITQLPKSSVSRYVSAEMAVGMLEEFIDPNDRRRRRLRPTDKARAEQRLHAQSVLAIHEEMKKIGLDGRSDQIDGAELARMLKAMNAQLLAALPPSSKAG